MMVLPRKLSGPEKSFDHILVRRALLHLIVISLFSMLGCGGGGGQPNLLSPGPVGNSPGKATLIWDAPTTNMDGTPITDLAGFKVYFGSTPGVYEIPVDAGVETTYTVIGFNPGTYYFAVTAYDTAGNESGYSNEGSKDIS